MDCVAVCPVDCFYEGENMLVINPDECIDCGVCEPECPANAIVADTAIAGPELEFLLNLNTKFSNLWPNITQMRPEDVPADAEQWHSVEGKIKYLSENPGKGD
jgi:ferredoxin